MDWKDVKGFVGKAAPMIGTLLGGPAGSAVGSMVASALGVENNPEAIEKALRDDKDALLKLRELEQREKEGLRKMTMDTLSLELADKQQARAVHKDHWMPSVLTCLLFVAVVMVSFGLYAYEVPESNKEVLFYVAGQIITAFLTAVAYWLGTSRSSHDKTKSLGKPKL